MSSIIEKEVKDFYSPKDLKIGATVVIYARAFLLYDCDNFTKEWYKLNFGINDFKPIEIEQTVSCSIGDFSYEKFFKFLTILQF